MMQRRALLASACALPLAACGNILGPGEAPQIYVLHTSFPAAPPGPKVPWGLAVMLPDAADTLDTERIPVIKPDGSMDYYAASRFPDRITALVQEALVAGFEASGRIDQVSAQQDALHADYNLVTEIRDFEAQYGDPASPPNALVTLSVKLVATRSRRIAANFSTRQSVPASADSVGAASQALEAALTAAANAVIAWALTAKAP